MPEIVTSLRIPNYAGAPGSPLKGQLYYDTGTDGFYYYNGAWILVGSWTLAQGPSGTAGTILGRGTSGVGPPEEITLGSGLSMSGTVLSVSAGGGNVSNTGTPVAGQYARWTSASVIEGVFTSTVKTDLALSKSDVGLGSVTNDVQTKAAIVPNTAPGAGQILVGNAGATAYAPVTLTGATLSSAGALSAIPNATLSNSAITIAGTSVSLGTSITLNTIMGVTVSTVGLNFLDLVNPGAITFPKIDATNNVIAESAATYRTSLGATTAGGNIFTLTNPSAISYPRIDATNAVTAASAATIKTDLSLNNVTNDAQIKASDFPASSVDGEISLFSSTSGKAQKRATGSGIVTAASGVYGTTTDNHTNWDTAFTDRNKWDGGATGLTAATGRTSLGIGDAAVWENASTAQQALSTSDAYVTGSLITLPAGTWIAGGQYRCTFIVVKTLGTGAIVISVRIGTAGTTADTAVYTATLPAGTSVGDNARFDLLLNVRTTGASATIMGQLSFMKNLTTTGMANTGTNVLTGTPSATTTFNSTTATKIGVSFNGSTAFAGTVDVVQAEYKQ